jgi:hypothetical protein
MLWQWDGGNKLVSDGKSISRILSIKSNIYHLTCLSGGRCFPPSRRRLINSRPVQRNDDLCAQSLLLQDFKASADGLRTFPHDAQAMVVEHGWNRTRLPGIIGEIRI